MSDLDPHVLANYLFPVLVVFTLAVAYWFFVRPILQKQPVFREVYAAEESALAALAAKFSGVKQRLATIFFSAIGFILLAHDEIAPLVTQAGVDPSQILPKVPSWLWPIITMVVLWIIQYFRKLADENARKNAEAMLNAGQPLAAPAPGLPVNTVPSPSPLIPLSFPNKDI